MRGTSVDMKFFPVLIYVSLLIFGMSAFTGKASAGQKQIGSVEEKILRDMHIDPHGSGVSIGQDRVIEVSEVVVDDVVIVGANLTVNGKVHGDAVCIGGNMKVGPQAEISGDMVNIGGQLTVDPSAKTNGERVNMGSSPFGSSKNSFFSGPQPFGNNWPGMNESDSEPTFTSKIILLALDVICLGFLLFFALILTVFMPKQFNHIEEHLSNDFPRCTLLGIALMIGFPVLLLGFVITLVGILAIPLLLLAWLLSCLLGYIAFARILGRRIISEKPIMLQILTGLLLLASPLLIGDVFLLVDGSFGSVIGHVFRVIGFIILIGVNFIGFGAVVYSLWGKRELLKFRTNKQNGSSGPPENGNGDAVAA
jgi:hypothetical protein